MGSLQDRPAAACRGQRTFQTSFAKFAQADSGLGGRLGEQAVVGQPGNRVDFQDPGPPLAIEPQIDPRQPLGADRSRGAAAGIDE